MGIWELLILAVGLSMDAFAVAVCKGLSVVELKPRNAVVTGFYFGGFQAAMPLAGYFLGKRYKKLPEKMIRSCTMNPEYWKKNK